jgi:hypothetical protein
MEFYSHFGAEESNLPPFPYQFRYSPRPPDIQLARNAGKADRALPFGCAELGKGQPGFGKMAGNPAALT